MIENVTCLDKDAVSIAFVDVNVALDVANIARSHNKRTECFLTTSSGTNYAVRIYKMDEETRKELTEYAVSHGLNWLPGMPVNGYGIPCEVLSND